MVGVRWIAWLRSRIPCRVRNVPHFTISSLILFSLTRFFLITSSDTALLSLTFIVARFDFDCAQLSTHFGCHVPSDSGHSHASLVSSFELSLSLDSRSRQIMYIVATFNTNFLGDPLLRAFLLSTPIEGPRTLTRASRQIELPCHRVRLVLWSNSFYLPSRSHICFTSAPLSRTTVGVLWTKAVVLYNNKH